MNQANRKAKPTRYTVTIVQTVKMTFETEVDARSVEEAEGLAEQAAEGLPYASWTDEVIASRSKAKVKR